MLQTLANCVSPAEKQLLRLAKQADQNRPQELSLVLLRHLPNEPVRPMYQVITEMI